MFNLLPGQGLGFTGSKLIACGLAPIFERSIEVPALPPIWGGGAGPGRSRAVSLSIYDNLYAARNDDNEIVEIISVLLGVIE